MQTSLRGFLICTLLFIASVLCAQEIEPRPEHTPEHEAEKQTETMRREINLTPNQAKLIYQINLKYARERQSSEDRRANAMERMRNKNNDYKKVLTPAQYEELEKRRVGIYSHTKKSSLDITYRTLPSSIRFKSDTDVLFQDKNPIQNLKETANVDSNAILINEMSTNQKLIPQKTE